MTGSTEDLMERFVDVLRALDAVSVEYVLVGGFAVILHGLPRLTQDLDLFVRPTERNLSKLREALDAVFHDPSIEEIRLSDFEHYPVIRYGTPEGFYVDILTRIGDAFSFEDLRWQTMTVSNIPTRVATVATLYEMKRNTVRPEDHSDALFLRALLDRTMEDEE
jgi:hypothetical protein